ncbi:hypothetical protein [Microbacterium sp. Leaf320]|uniref:hypothetical protein n=1 Tax=Microbacterium sp. Leaf320 TaxID=1736334 RepID=UPI0007011D95|nr:hypothetical protein [Microbacterium sp. Leaf320]KQQ66103.1 hypothetical protein ASF63_12335 [Microbacterium sp. Leaf320]
MGANLVGRAIAYAVDVPLQPNEFRLLVGICLTAHDDHTPPRYFDSREAMALILGRRIPDAVTGLPDPPERAAGLKSVKVAMKGLTDLHALRRTKTGGHGRRAEFEVILDVAKAQQSSVFKARDRRPSMTATEARRRRGGGTAAVPVKVLRQSPLGDYGSTDEGLRQSPSGTTGKQDQQEEEQVA